MVGSQVRYHDAGHPGDFDGDSARGGMMTGKLTIQCRLLRQAELEQGVAMLKSAYDWLHDQGIRQWTAPLSMETHQGLGRMAVQHAAEVAAETSDALYVMCAFGTGFLPNYYQSLGFAVLKRELKLYGDFGLYDMVLMRRGWATADGRA